MSSISHAHTTLKSCAPWPICRPFSVLVRYEAASSRMIPRGLPSRQIGHASPLQSAAHSPWFHLLISSLQRFDEWFSGTATMLPDGTILLGVVTFHNFQMELDIAGTQDERREGPNTRFLQLWRSRQSHGQLRKRKLCPYKGDQPRPTNQEPAAP